MQTSNHGEYAIGTVQVDPHPEHHYHVCLKHFPYNTPWLQDKKVSRKIKQVMQNLLEGMWKHHRPMLLTVSQKKNPKQSESQQPRAPKAKAVRRKG